MTRPRPWRALYLLPFLFALGAGDCGAPEEKPPEAPSGGGGGAQNQGGGGGGASTPEAPKERPQASLEEKYRRGQDLLKRKQLDEAADELQAVAAQEAGSPLGVKAAADRKQAVAELAKLPATPLAQLGDLRGKKASARGTFLSAGRTGQSELYFWLVEKPKKIQCRFASLPPGERQLIADARDGDKVLVRGTVVGATTGSGFAALDLSFFKNE